MEGAKQDVKDVATGIITSYDETREKNIEEWNSYEDKLKEDITTYNQRMLNHSMKLGQLRQKQEGLVSSAELYKSKFDAFETLLKGSTKSKEEIEAMFQQEKERLQARLDFVNLAVGMSNEEYDKIDVKKQEFTPWKQTI